AADIAAIGANPVSSARRSSRLWLLSCSYNGGNERSSRKEKERMAIISRGFSGRRETADVKLPPGQYLTTDFPVLSAGPTPRVPLDTWEFTINEGAGILKRWDWKSFRELPTEKITVDLHCVTRWSKLGTAWEGVSLDVLLADVKTNLPYAMFHSY